MKVLVTGAGGQVAKLITPALADLGIMCFGYDISSGDDIHDRENLVRKIKEYEVEGVIHLAGIRGPELLGRPVIYKDHIIEEKDYYDDNYDGSINVFEATREAGIKHFVFLSSNDVYGLSVKDPVWPITDKTPYPSYNSLYAKLKLEFGKYMKKHAKEYGICAVSLRAGGFLSSSAYPWHVLPVTLVRAFANSLRRNTPGFRWYNIAEEGQPVDISRAKKDHIL